jgi:hypothetical protein
MKTDGLIDKCFFSMKGDILLLRILEYSGS